MKGVDPKLPKIKWIKHNKMNFNLNKFYLELSNYYNRKRIHILLTLYLNLYKEKFNINEIDSIDDLKGLQDSKYKNVYFK